MHRDLLSPFFLLLLTLPACVTPSEPVDQPPPLAATEEDATFASGDLDLVGTLRLPERPEGTPVPSVVLVHGSGPNSRDSVLSGQLNMQFGFDIAVFAELADALQEAGYAVLTYDKRTCGTWAGCDNDYPLPEELLADDFVADAQAAGRWLAAHEATLSGVHVIGHSQGAAFLPSILADEPAFASGIALAGNWRPIDAMLRYQLDFSVQLLEDAGATQQQIDDAVGPLRDMVEDLEALRAGTFQGASIGGSPTAFWASWLAIGDARPALVAAETRPLHALFGGYDWNIPPDPEQDLWAAAGVPTHLVPCLSHALNCVGDEDGVLPASELERAVNAEVIDSVTGWLADE